MGLVEWRRRQRSVRCLVGKAGMGTASRGVDVEAEELGPVLKFKMDDFVVANYVSIGLHGRVCFCDYEFDCFFFFLRFDFKIFVIFFL